MFGCGGLQQLEYSDDELMDIAADVGAAPTAPTIDHPRDGGTYPSYRSYDLEVQSDDVGFVGTGTHKHSDWEFRDASGGGGNLLQSSYNDSTN